MAGGSKQGRGGGGWVGALIVVALVIAGLSNGSEDAPSQSARTGSADVAGSSADARSAQKARAERRAARLRRERRLERRERALARRERRLRRERREQRELERIAAQQAQPEPEPAEEPAGDDCDPNYSGCLDPNSSDYDCEGGSGDGPDYVQGPIQVLGDDHYDLERDDDGTACDV